MLEKLLEANDKKIRKAYKKGISELSKAGKRGKVQGLFPLLPFSVSVVNGGLVKDKSFTAKSYDRLTPDEAYAVGIIFLALTTEDEMSLMEYFINTFGPEGEHLAERVYALSSHAKKQMKQMNSLEIFMYEHENSLAALLHLPAFSSVAIARHYIK